MMLAVVPRKRMRTPLWLRAAELLNCVALRLRVLPATLVCVAHAPRCVTRQRHSINGITVSHQPGTPHRYRPFWGSGARFIPAHRPNAGRAPAERLHVRDEE